MSAASARANENVHLDRFAAVVLQGFGLCVKE